MERARARNLPSLLQDNYKGKLQIFTYIFWLVLSGWQIPAPPRLPSSLPSPVVSVWVHFHFHFWSQDIIVKIHSIFSFSCRSGCKGFCCRFSHYHLNNIPPRFQSLDLFDRLACLGVHAS